jgi:hypothetical protein
MAGDTVFHSYASDSNSDVEEIYIEPYGDQDYDDKSRCKLDPRPKNDMINANASLFWRDSEDGDHYEP